MKKLKFLGLVKDEDYISNEEWSKDLTVGDVYENVDLLEIDYCATIIDDVNDEVFLSNFRLNYFEVVE